MKKLLYLFIVVILFFQSAYSQEKYDWENIQKVELYSFQNRNKWVEISSKDLNQKTLVKCKTENIIKHLKELKEYEFDVIIEPDCYALRVYFQKSHTDFLLFPEQGVIFRMTNGKDYFRIAKRNEFEKLIQLY